jgi:hypothetical protein
MAHATHLVAELTELKASCHSLFAAGFYRGLQKEIQTEGQPAMFLFEEEVRA